MADPAAQLAPTGKLRGGVVVSPAASTFFAIKDGKGDVHGFTLDLLRAFAETLKLPLVLQVYDNSGQVTDAVASAACDLAFMPRDAAREAKVDFGPAYYFISSTYLVPAGSAIRSCADAERPSVRVAIVSSHASALALRRRASQADLIGSELPDDAFALLVAGKVDAFALPREQLLDYSGKLPGSCVLDDSYGINRVAMAVQKGRSGWRAYFSEFVEDAKASGLIAQIIARGALRGFQVAAPESIN